MVVLVPQVLESLASKEVAVKVLVVEQVLLVQVAKEVLLTAHKPHQEVLVA